MNTDMKKLTAIATGIAAVFSAALPAYATAAQVNLCPSGPLATLCSLNAQKFATLIGNFITILLIIAAVIAIFFLIWGGIKWITSSGDKTKVESARNTIISSIVGLIIAFLAYFIISLVLSIFGVGTTFTLPTLGK